MIVRRLFSKIATYSALEKPALFGSQKASLHFFSKSQNTLPDPSTGPSAYNNPNLNKYLKKVFGWTALGTATGITSALLGTFIPMGLPLAYFVISGAAMDVFSTNYLENTRPKIERVKDSAGKFVYETKNPLIRKLAYLTFSSGIACFAAPALSIVGVASVLPIAATISVTSAIGHLLYCAYAGKGKYNPWQSALFGAASGFIGLNLLGMYSPSILGALAMMEGDALYLQGLNMGGYLSLALYNMFTAYDSQKVAEDYNVGKEDCLVHGSKFTENWMLTIIPYVLFS